MDVAFTGEKKMRELNLGEENRIHERGQVKWSELPSKTETAYLLSSQKGTEN